MIWLSVVALLIGSATVMTGSVVAYAQEMRMVSSATRDVVGSFDTSPEEFEARMKAAVRNLSDKPTIKQSACDRKGRFVDCFLEIDEVTVIARGTHSPARTTRILVGHFRERAGEMALPLGMIIVQFDPQFLSESLDDHDNSVGALLRSLAGGKAKRLTGKGATYNGYRQFDDVMKAELVWVAIEPRQ
jgi:hypothetical protein